MNVHVHIERLVLDGLPVEAGSGAAVRAAVEAELAELITEHGLGSGLQRGGAHACMRGGNIAMCAGPDPDALGKQIGGAVHRGLMRQ
jgi:hypothetical protein